MPPLERTDLRQKIVWFPQTGQDTYGRWKHGPPQQIMGRWLTTRSTTVDAEGNNIQLDAQVVVAQVVSNGDLMWLGTLENWLYADAGGVGSGDAPTELMEVKTFSSAPDIKARNNRTTCGLMRYREKP